MLLAVRVRLKYAQMWMNVLHSWASAMKMQTVPTLTGATFVHAKLGILAMEPPVKVYVWHSM